jgi:PAS domain S-box-containing protein
MNLAPPDTPAAEKTETQLLDRVLVTAFLENVPDHVYFKDRDSRFIALSASMARLFGQKTVDDLIGKTDFDFFDEAHARPAFEDEQTIIRTGQPILGKLEKESWPDGRVTWVLTNKMPLRDEHGEIIGTFGISKDVTESKKMELALEKSRKELMDASRMAGMAEVATGVLHNVGNVLNSLNVSATVLATGLRQSKTDSLVKVSDLLRAHTADLGGYLTQDAKGRLVPGFIDSLARHFAEDRARLLKEIESLQQNVEHIKEIVTMQQTYATMVGVIEPLEAATLMEDSVRMNSGALVRHDVQVIRDFQSVPLISAEKGKVLQILVNLIRNGKYACDEGGRADKVLTLRITPGAPGRVRLIVQDNGVGIAAEHLTSIFQHGFTTRATGHGFGLHSSANAAKEMKGTLTVHSDGLGAGAMFTLDLPAAGESIGPAC